MSIQTSAVRAIHTNCAEKATDVAVRHSIYIYSLSLSTFLSLVLCHMSFISNEKAVSLLLLSTFLYPTGHQQRNTEVRRHIINQEVRVITHLRCSPRLLIGLFRYLKFYIAEEPAVSCS